MTVGLDDTVAGQAPPTPVPARPTEPRPEIWFRRRVGIRAAVRDLWRSRELVVTLAERDLRVRYKQAFLGFAWAVFTPVMLMLVFTFVFTKFAQVKTPGVPYPLFAYLGLIPWTFFSNALAGGGMSLINNMQIVNRINCPREVFPLATIVVAAVDTAISCLVLVVIFAVTGFVPRTEALYIPLLLPALIAFTLGLTLVVSSLLVYLRDLRHALPLLIQFGLFATPVAYGVTVFAHTRAQLLVYSALIPLAPVIDGLRRTVLYGQHPQWESLAIGTTSGLVLLAVGYRLFKRLETGIADIA